jgi:hypothetical protein
MDGKNTTPEQNYILLSGAHPILHANETDLPAYSSGENQTEESDAP